MSKFDGLLGFVKEYIVDVWEIQGNELYNRDSGSGLTTLCSIFTLGEEW